MSENQPAATPVGNRWLIVVGALLIQLCLGAIYAWSAFTGPLQSTRVEVLVNLDPNLLGLRAESKAEYDKVKVEVGDQLKVLTSNVRSALKEKDKEREKVAKDELATFRKTRLTDDWVATHFDKAKFDAQAFGFSGKDAQWPYSVGLAAFALTMIFAGRWQDKAGPRIVALCGGLVLGTGYLLGGFIGTSFWPLLLCIGVISGAGIGLGYVCPIAACVKWFPDMKGLITGLAVAGFGAGAFIFGNMAGKWGGLVKSYGVNGTFIILGVIFLVGVVAGALLLCNPPPGYKPAGWNPPQPSGGAKKVAQDLTQGQTIKMPQCWLMWLSFVFSGGCGLMIIGSIANFGELEGGLTVGVGAALAGVLAIFNGLGRVVWGTLGQKLTPRVALIIMVFLQAAMMFVLPELGTQLVLLGVGACWVGFNFGGNFALFPLLTAEFFGTKNLGANYGAVFTAYGVGGVLGPIMAGGIWDSMGTYRWAFYIAGVACVLAGLIALVLRAPSAPETAVEKAAS